jgi:hypothetical protein
VIAGICTPISLWMGPTQPAGAAGRAAGVGGHGTHDHPLATPGGQNKTPARKANQRSAECQHWSDVRAFLPLVKSKCAASGSKWPAIDHETVSSGLSRQRHWLNWTRFGLVETKMLQCSKVCRLNANE